MPDRSNSPSRRVDLRQLIEGLTDAVVVVDEAGEIVLVNAMTEKLFGYERADLVGESIELLLPERLAEVHVAHRHKYFQAPRSRSMGVGLDLTGRRCDGTEVPVEIGLSAIETDEGLLVASVITDVTVRRRLEEELRQTQKLEAIGRLAGGIAHDFNNQLTAILGYANFIHAEAAEGSSVHGDSAQIIAAGERAAALTHQLLIFTRNETLEARAIDANVELRAIETMLVRLIGEQVHVTSRLEPDLWPVMADPGQFSQVVTNLVLNARDAMPRGGELAIETKNVLLEDDWPELPSGVYVCVSVSDSGTGMDEETRRNALEPFFTTKEPGKGTGLGLSTVYGIVEQSGGMLRIYSELDRGTTVKVYLPRATGEVPVGIPTSMTEVPRGSGLILLVEDEQIVKSLVARMLAEIGYEVVIAATSLEAIGLFELHSADVTLLLTDVVMPQLGGRELAERLVARVPLLPVLFMSGYTEDASLRLGLLGPRFGFIEKPFSKHGLAIALHDLVGGA